MLTDEIAEFYRDVGIPLEQLVDRKPRGASRQSVLKAAEEVFDSGCYQLIEMPRAIWRKAIDYIPEDFVAEQRNQLGVAYWSKKYIDTRNNYRAFAIVTAIVWSITMGVWIWKAM